MAGHLTGNDNEMQDAMDHLKKAEKDLEVARAAENAAESEIREALEEIEEAEKHQHKVHFEIKIDRSTYRVEQDKMTGQQLRVLPSPPIGPEFDLFEVVPGGSDRKIEDNEVVEMRNGLRFFTASAHINPGRC